MPRWSETISQENQCFQATQIFVKNDVHQCMAKCAACLRWLEEGCVTDEKLNHASNQPHHIISIPFLITRLATRRLSFADALFAERL